MLVSTVQVDSSTYTIHPASRVREWVSAVPPHFRFHFKIFGFFPAKQVTLGHFPGPVRPLLPEEFQDQSGTNLEKNIKWDNISEECK